MSCRQPPARRCPYPFAGESALCLPRQREVQSDVGCRRLRAALLERASIVMIVFGTIRRCSTRQRYDDMADARSFPAADALPRCLQREARAARLRYVAAAHER